MNELLQRSRIVPSLFRHHDKLRLRSQTLPIFEGLQLILHVDCGKVVVKAGVNKHTDKMILV